MKKFFKIFFITLGVIFLLIILAGLYFYITDPLGLRSTGSLTLPMPANQEQTTEEGVVLDKNPALTESQEKMLETVGIDPAAVPSSITPEQEACFVEKIGQQRVDEIAAGDSPSLLEIAKGKDCI